MPPPGPASRPSAIVRFCSVKAMPESTVNTCTLLPPLIVTTPPPSMVVGALMSFVPVTVMEALPPQENVTVPSNPPPAGRQASSAASVQLGAVPVPTRQARTAAGRRSSATARARPAMRRARAVSMSWPSVRSDRLRRQAVLLSAARCSLPRRSTLRGAPGATTRRRQSFRGPGKSLAENPADPEILHRDDRDRSRRSRFVGSPRQKRRDTPPAGPRRLRHRHPVEHAPHDLVRVDLLRFGLVAHDHPVPQHVGGDGLHVLRGHVAAALEEGVRP